MMPTRGLQSLGLTPGSITGASGQHSPQCLHIKPLCKSPSTPSTVNRTQALWLVSQLRPEMELEDTVIHLPAPGCREAALHRPALTQGAAFRWLKLGQNLILPGFFPDPSPLT